MEHRAATYRCSWCGAAVDADEGYRLLELPGERHAVFCRLEHLVPWALRGAHWEAGALPSPSDELPARCAECGAELGDVRVIVVHHRGEEQVADGFCSADHARAWATSGGRYR